ncbi:MAG: hypothetical protein JO264_15530 [Acidisphaera sp.]|nr:hypothetical protein [Acidisphaera sp.]
MTRPCPPAAGLLVLTLLAGAAGLSPAARADAVYHISQIGRAFSPDTLEIKRGETVRIVNDDGELIHHAYVKSESFNFDSGEQDPGDHIDIRFTVPGVFVVRCDIHPKMHLTVTVR